MTTTTLSRSEALADAARQRRRADVLGTLARAYLDGEADLILADLSTRLQETTGRYAYPQLIRGVLEELLFEGLVALGGFGYRRTGWHLTRRAIEELPRVVRDLDATRREREHEQVWTRVPR